MFPLETDSWPPEALITDRLLLREAAARDRSPLIELFSSPEVGAFIGGPQPRAELERNVPEVPGRRPGFFVVEHDGVMIGMVTVDRHDPQGPGRGHLDPGVAVLGYLFLPQAWGQGYATEACRAVLTWFDGVFPGEAMALCTQLANTSARGVAAKLGFIETARFEEYGAGQWLAVRKAVPGGH
ncbi:GNAT family N-acetyltransferase [Arthrobacter sp. NPDC090010]|uniref:GNAT family N-acetyltransferase n=1 Tax=Arthrobacter sp. NPDC090010 TaxID=3363942 RepID=UPI00381D42EB